MNAAVVRPLAAMLLTQTAAAMTLAVVPVLATEIARDTGIRASAVGAYTALVFAAAMFSSAASGRLIARLGALGANQAVLVVSGLALLVTLAATVPLIAVSALLVGAGYGPNTPSGSHLLAQVTPPRMRGMVFSIKQSGAPLGAMLAGLLLPAVTLVAGWQVAVACASLLVVGTALVVHPLHRHLPAAPAPCAPAGRRGATLVAVRAALATPALRRLTLAAFLLMILHTCFQTFTVAFLVEHVELSLTRAGGLFAVLGVAAAAARIGLGWLADHVARPRSVLVVVSVGGVASCLLFAALDAGWHPALMTLACALAGVTTAGWYGVFLAEVARQAPRQAVGLATGGALFFVYSSIVAGPLAFSAAVAASGSWPAVLTGLAGLTLVATWNLARLPA